MDLLLYPSRIDLLDVIVVIVVVVLLSHGFEVYGYLNAYLKGLHSFFHRHKLTRSSDEKKVVSYEVRRKKDTIQLCICL